VNKLVFAAPAAIALLAFVHTPPAAASPTPVFFSTGNPDGSVATASRPGVNGAFEIESADDFFLNAATTLTSATFTGLVPTNSRPSDVVVEIYRVFPNNSKIGRTSGPPDFSTPKVPTRKNSPSDVAIASRDSAASGELKFLEGVVQSNFSANNSVQPGGINPKPNQTTLGDGPVSGDEVEFSVTLTKPITLPAGHYFFVPQVALDSGDFLWLSAPKPIVAPGTPFPVGDPNLTDLQSWTRDQFLDPDWLRVGSDIIGTGAFNATFSLTGQTFLPEPGTLAVLGTAVLGLGALRRRRR
jgi:hypothetical protein